MNRQHLAAALIVAALAWTGAAEARPVLTEPPEFEPTRTLHVSPFGDDGNDGLAQDRAFRTISAAAEAVEPGDLVLVRGGTYFEHVHLEVPGTEDRPIVFRAAPGETALVVRGRAPEGWERIPDTRHAYRTVHEAIPNYVMDQRFTARYAEVRDIGTLDESPGSFIYDEDERMLSVHPLRSLPPDEVKVVVLEFPEPDRRGYTFDKGMWTRAPHNRIEGFHIAHQPFGIQLRADDTEAWGNTVYGCAVTGIQAHTGENLVLANNVSFMNDGSGVHISSRAEAGTLAGNVSWGNTQRGPLLHRSSGGHSQQLALYGAVPDPTIEGNLALANVNPLERGTRLMRYKSARGTVATRHNILVGGRANVGWGAEAAYEFNTIVGGDFRVRGADGPVITPESAEEAGSRAEGNLYLNNMEEAGFADPERWDFRLRSDSPHLGSGAWPEAAPVRYVSPEGDDGADGNTPTTAWRTLGHAASAVEPGDTVYVMPGEYAENVTLSVQGSADSPVEFLTYGRGRVVLDGGGREEPTVAFQGATHVKMDGFIFRNASEAAVSIAGSGDIVLKDNVFDGAETAVALSDAENATLENNTFANCGEGVQAREVRGRLVLRNSLYARGRGNLADVDAASSEALISERNAFAGPDADAQLEAWTESVREGHPSLAADVDVEGPDYLLPALSRYAFAGLGLRPLGARGEAEDDSPIVVENFRVHHASPERAVAEWVTPHEYPNARVTWTGPNGESRRATVRQDGFGETLRQTRQVQVMDELEPGVEYTVSLEVWTPNGRSGETELAFQTPTELRDPETLHVCAETGDDGNDGRAEESAFRTITAAVYDSSPGDTILVAPGVYTEMVQLLGGGLDSERRLVLRSTEPGQAIMDLGGIRPGAFLVHDVEHVTLDGFRFTGMTYGSLRHVICIQDAEDIEVTRCVFDRSPDGRVTSQLLNANRATDLLIHNNLFQAGFNNIRAWHVDRVTVDRNTFYRAGVTSIQLHGPDDAEYTFTNNIFYEVSTRGHGAMRLHRPTGNITVQNNLYYRSEDSLQGLVSFRRSVEGEALPHRENPKTPEALQEEYGLGQGDRKGDPLFVDAEDGDFRLQPDSPARGMATDDGDVGMQDPPAGL